MSSVRRERIRKLGRVRFIWLFGVCCWGLPFGLAFVVPFGLPGLFLVHWLHGQSHFEASGIWWCLVVPMLISAVGGYEWGSRMWAALYASPPEASSHPST